MPSIRQTLADAFAAYDPQKAIPSNKPTREDYWRKRLANQGAISKPERTIGGMIADALAAGGRKAGLGDRYAQHVATRATNALNDLTPVGNVTGAEEGGKQAVGCGPGLIPTAL
jgi:hypothetical protein